MKKFLRKFIKDRHPLLLFYHKIKGLLAIALYMNPSRNIKVIGVTGTNGKTTTVNLIAGLLEAAGHKVGYTSTLRYKIGDEVWVNKEKMTTQSPFLIQKMLKRMVKAGCDYAVLEVTSHAVDQSRVIGINFDVGVFTNLTGDHLEYHGSFEEYMRAKGKFIGSLFSMKRKKNVPKVLVLNADDPNFDYYNQFNADQKITFGVESKHLTIKASDVELGAFETKLKLTMPNAEAELSSKLLGGFNVYNIVAAASVAISQGISLDSVQAGLDKILPIGGRLEPVNLGQDFSVIVDYAHTADAYENLCFMFKPLTEGKLIFVGGATGGGRDKSKRPDMGKAVSKHADLFVITDDDPYTEDSWSIINQLESGVEGDCEVVKIVDRAEAVRYALTIAQKGDTVLIAGKGGEEVIAKNGKLIPYDDRLVARKVISEEIFSHVTL